MRISIALKTYNGLPFLRAQLDSILGQTRLPDELVACDDGSSDGTWELLSGFQRTAPFEVRLVRNPEVLGPVANGAKAISLCTGDIVLPSDQDDVSLPGKLAAFERAFEGRGLGLVIADSTVTDETLTPRGYSLWESNSFTPEQRRGFPSRPLAVLFKANQATSGAMAIRSDVARHVVPLPARWAHDGWAALVAAALGPVGVLDEPVQLYRQHPTNVVPQDRPSLWGRARRTLRFAAGGRKALQDLADYWEAALGRLEGLGPATARLEDLRWARRRVLHLRARAALPARGLQRAKAVRSELRNGNYRAFSNGLASAAKDLLL